MSNPNSIVFQRGSDGDASQTISYWAGSHLVAGGGGPVPNFGGVNQPAWVDIAMPGSHTITYVSDQPIDQQIVFMNIYVNGDKTKSYGYVQATLNKDGTLTDVSSKNLADGVVVKNPSEQNEVAVMIPANL